MSRVRLRLLRASSLAVLSAALLVVSTAGPAAAYSLIQATGKIGNYDFTESSGSPGVTCAYGPVVSPDYMFMRWIKVRAPIVFAYDPNPGSPGDHGKVSWKFELQRKLQPDGAWTNVSSSPVQRATAWDNKQAAFTPIKLVHDGHAEGSTSAYSLRALVIIKWYKPSGAVEGTVKFTPTYYKLKEPVGTSTSGGDYCDAISTLG